VDEEKQNEEDEDDEKDEDEGPDEESGCCSDLLIPCTRTQNSWHSFDRSEQRIN
jgi:hypothetical protein